MKSYLIIKKKKLIQILELENELFDLITIKNENVKIDEYKKAELEIELKINTIRKQISFW